MVEEKADQILSEARESDVAFLVVGDPFGYVDFVYTVIYVGSYNLFVHGEHLINMVICSFFFFFILIFFLWYFEPFLKGKQLEKVCKA